VAQGLRGVIQGRAGRAPGSPDLLAGYYLATPLFAALEAVAGWPVRLAGFPDQGSRWGWYLILFLLGLLCLSRPRLAPLVGMGESSVNLTFLFLSILLPIWGMPEELDQVAGPIAFGPVRIVNVLLSGGALILAFHRSQWAWGGHVGEEAQDRPPPR